MKIAISKATFQTFGNLPFLQHYYTGYLVELRSNPRYYFYSIYHCTIYLLLAFQLFIFISAGCNCRSGHLAIRSSYSIPTTFQGYCHILTHSTKLQYSVSSQLPLVLESLNSVRGDTPLSEPNSRLFLLLLPYLRTRDTFRRSPLV